MKSFEIYFHDLNEESQKAYLEFQGVTSSEELNEEISPLAIIDKEEEEPEDPDTHKDYQPLDD